MVVSVADKILLEMQGQSISKWWQVSIDFTRHGGGGQEVREERKDKGERRQIKKWVRKKSLE